MAEIPDPTDDGPAPDPGNSPPEDWTEDLDPAEVEAILELLRAEGDG